MKKYEIKKCLFCSSEIIKKFNESIATYYTRKFCKLSCQHKWIVKNKNSHIKCDFCRKEFIRRNSGIKKHNFCSSLCKGKYNTLKNTKFITCSWCGKEFRRNLYEVTKTQKAFCSRKCMGEWQAKYLIGEAGYNWRGGCSQINHRIRSLVKYLDWVKNVFRKDNYTCQNCGDKKGGNLNAHHINPLSLIIKENNIKEIIDAIECEELWDINNGTTLCEDCHSKNNLPKNKVR